MKLTTSNASVSNSVNSSRLTFNNNISLNDGNLLVGNVTINSSAAVVGLVRITPETISTPTLVIGGTPFSGGAFGGIVDYQEFPAVGVWYNPLAYPSLYPQLTGNEQVFVMVWGGGSGGASNNSIVKAGGGGAAAIGHYRLSELSSTVSVTVGSGGTATRTTTSAVGTAGVGGNTSFGSLIAYGAGASATTAANGSGGGGILSAGSGVNGGSPLNSTTSTYGGGNGGNAGAGGSSIFGGGGGGSGSSGDGGASIYGGGGGRGGAGEQGKSVFGGNGGEVPGGGGGANTSAATAGARGEVRVWVIGPGATTA